MIALINHYGTFPIDLSVRVGGRFERAALLPAEVTGGGLTRPSYVYLTDAHVAALQALDSSDIRRQRITSAELLDLGAVGPDGPFAPAAVEALKAALAPRRTNIINVMTGQVVR